LWILDSVPDDHFMQFGYTNPNDTEGLMDLISAGSQIVLFVTGRGSVIGSPVAPLVKVTGNSATFRAMEDDMDRCRARAVGRTQPGRSRAGIGCARGGGGGR
jgi:altronate hydrolase